MSDMIVVILGREQKDAEDFRFHPHVKWIQTDAATEWEEVEKQIPPHTVLFITTDKIPHSCYHKMNAYFRAQKTPYMFRRGPAALSAALSNALKGLNGNEAQQIIPGERKRIAEKGSIKKLLDESGLDFKKDTGELARALLGIAQTKGIPTTLASLMQAVRSYKREKGLGEIPKSALSPRAAALRTLDECIAGLQVMRDYVMETEQKNIELEAKLERFRKALE